MARIKLISLLKVATLCLFILFGLNNCINNEEKIDRVKESEQIITALNNVFSWAVKKDFKLFFNTISNDSNYISVTPYKRVKFGIEDVKKDSAFWASPYFKAIRHEIRELKIRISRSGDVAWFFCFIDDINEWKGQPANWENVRWTGVLEKRNDKWVVVQMHFSFASK